MKRSLFALPVMILGAFLAGCAKTDVAGVAPAATLHAAGKEKFLAAAEPSGAKGVIAVKKDARDGDPVVVVGRIGGGKKPFTGRASFTLVDLSLEPNDEDGCGDPFCWVDRDDLLQATTLVKFVDESGKTLPQDARGYFGVRELQTVVVRGRVKRDADNALSVVADEMYARP